MLITVRKVVYNNNEIMLQRRTWGFFFTFVFLCIPFLGWLALLRPPWRNWKLLNNKLYKIDGKIDKKVNTELQKLLDERVTTEEWLKAEKKEITDSKRYRRGESEPFSYPVKVNDYFFFRREPDLFPVDDGWRKMLNPKLFKGSKAAPNSIREKVGAPEHRDSSGISAYMPSDLAPLKIAVEQNNDGLDHVMIFKEPSDKSSKSDRKRRDGETEREHRERLRKMDRAKSGQGDDDF